MQRLLEFALEEPSDIEALRRKCNAAPGDIDAQIAFGFALSQSGCTYEAAVVLRPLRSAWKSSDAAEPARAALDAQGWWNKNWREFAQLKRAGKRHAALELLGDRAVQYWDLPALLVHLGDFAAEDGQLELAEHLYRRVGYLSQRGLPKMNVAAFEYVAQASLVDVLLLNGKPAEALEQHLEITPNHSNVMAHEMQHAKLLVATGDLDAAMRQAAAMIVTANKHRSGFSKTMRLDFVEQATELAPLREHADWAHMNNDPAAYLQGSRGTG